MLERRTEKQTLARATGGARGAGAMTAWWMICRSVGGRVEAMTVPSYGGEALALFGHEEEAELVLWSLGGEGSVAGWRIRESRCGEVASVLCGPCAGVERVVLDPLPAMVADGRAELVSMDRVGFMAGLLTTDGAAFRELARRAERMRNLRRARKG